MPENVKKRKLAIIESGTLDFFSNQEEIGIKIDWET